MVSRTKEKNDELSCFVDASLGTNDSNGRSTTGLIVYLFGDPIFWCTKKQSHVSLSTAEAEYIGMSLAVKELVCVQEMLRRLVKIELIPILYEDNMAAINIAKSDDSSTLKHIVKLCFHYVRLEVARKNLIIKWISTKDQLADILTKALGVEKFEYQRSLILKEIES